MKVDLNQSVTLLNLGVNHNIKKAQSCYVELKSLAQTCELFSK